MRVRQWVPGNRLFYKILLYFLSLLIPIVIIGAVTYTNFVATYKRDFTENARRNLEISADQLDVHLRTVQEAGIGLFGDTAVSRLLKPDSQYTLADRASLIDILQSLKRTSSILAEFADPVFMFIDDQKVYTTSGIEDFDPFFQRVAKYDRFGADYWRTAKRSDQSIEILEPSSLNADQAGGRVVPVLVSRMVRGYNAVLVANIPVKALQQKLKGYAPFPSTQFVALDGFNRLVFGPDQPAEGESALLGKLAETFPAGEKGSAELTIGGTTYMTTFVQSGLYGWKLYALTPVGEFTRQASGILRMIVIICIVLVVVGVLFSFLFAFKLYTPIQRIKDALADHKDKDGEPEPPVDDYDEIGLGIDRLIRHNMTFERQLSSARFDYLDQALLHLLKDRETVNGAELERLLREQLGFTRERFRCCTVHFQFKDAFYEHIQDEDRIVVWGKLKKLIRGFLNGHFRLHVLELTRHLYLCVIEPDGTEQDEAAIKKTLDSFMQTFQFDLQFCNVHIGIGTVHEGIKGIAESYKEAVVALQHVDERLDCEIVSYDTLHIQPSVVYTFTDENKLLNLLKTGEPAVAEHVRQLYVQQESRGLPYHALSVLVTDLYRTGLRFVLEQGMERDVFASEEQHGLLTDSGEWPLPLEQKKAALFAFYDKLAAELQARQQTFRASTLLAAIMELIETEYDRDLYLETISDRLHVSAKYVSRMFKEKTGMNITQYLNIVRVERAKELLARTETPIGEIADQVGIHNRTTFLRIFKKIEGVTPQSYRLAAQRPEAE